MITDRKETVIVDGGEGGGFHHHILPSQPHRTRREQIPKSCAQYNSLREEETGRKK
jgi:hypothetical protein